MAKWRAAPHIDLIAIESPCLSPIFAARQRLGTSAGIFTRV